jgi:carboxylesterase type B
MGQSAGAVSITLLLYSPGPLLQRAAVLGGTALGLLPEPIQFHDSIFPVILKALGIDPSLSAEEKIKRLKELPTDAFTVQMNVPTRPLVDGTFLPECPTFRDLQDTSKTTGNPSWLKEILLTDCEADVYTSPPRWS